jgi:predicted acetyltransferase
MELRELTLDDYPAFNTLWHEAFRGGRAPDSLDPPDGWLDSARLGAFERTKLAAITTVHSMTLIWGDHDAPCGGIADVACSMARRGRGFAAGLLRESLHRMHDRGQYLSGLGPFSYRFYQRFGWDWVGEMRRITLPAEIAPAFIGGGDIETYEGGEALELIKPLYLRYARQYRGMCDRVGRVPDWWDQRLGSDNSHKVYVHVYRDSAGGAPTGYLTFRHPQGGDTAQIGDFVAFDAAAYRALLSVLHYSYPLVKRIVWEAPMDDPLPVHVMERGLEQSVAPLFMGRIVDVKAALESISPAHGMEGKLTVRVVDKQCSWNDQAFAVEAGSGHVRTRPTTTQPDIELDIRALSQAYWGCPSLGQLLRAGRVEVHDERSYELLSRLLPPAVAFLQNWF